MDSQLLSQVPKNLTIKNLIHQNQSAKIIMAGIERRNLMHGAYIYGTPHIFFCFFRFEVDMQFLFCFV